MPEGSRSRLVCSTGTLPAAVGGSYYDLEAVVAGACAVGALDLELVLQPDWRPFEPPRDRRPEGDRETGKWTTSQIISVMGRWREATGGRIRSVHANSDIGCFLGSRDEGERRTGIRLLEDACGAAEELGADIVVLHMWNTWADDISTDDAARRVRAFAEGCPHLSLAVENIPISARGWSQAELMFHLSELLPPRVGFTLDLSWSSMYRNLDHLLDLLPRVRNVHVQGRLGEVDGRTVLLPRAGDMDLGRAVARIRDRGYSGQWTLELNRPRSPGDFLRAMSYLECLLDGAIIPEEVDLDEG